MIHDFSPLAFRFSDDTGVHWYGLSYMLGFIFAYLMIRWISHRQKVGLTPDSILDLVTYGAVGVLLGGRLGYCLFYSPDLFIKFKSEFPYWGILAMNEGGMAAYGGMIGFVLACWFVSRKYGLQALYLFDLGALVAPLGIFMGRLATFLNGELVGREAPSTFKWAVKFPQDIYLWPKYEPGRLAPLGDVVEKAGMSKVEWLSWVEQFRTNNAVNINIHTTLEKIVHEIQNGNEAVKVALGNFLVPRYPSQIFSALGEGLLLFLILFFLWRKPRQSGFIASSFLILYALVRIIVENFQLPDVEIGYQIWNLTRGQILSIFAFAIGLLIMFIWNRSVSATVPGWGRVYSIRLNRK